MQRLTKRLPLSRFCSAEIVRKFAGREHQLCAKLFKKYGETLELTSMGGSGDPVEVTTAGGAQLIAKVKKYQGDFVPYALPSATDSWLDLRSAEFHALKALQASQKLLKMPVTTAYPLDNIQKCRHLLPESDPNHQTLVVRLKKSSLVEVKGAASVKKKSETTLPSLFDQLADTYLDGPFRVLRRCFLERMRVFVVIRRVNSVRGTCSGFLKAFDKHMNLVLLDVMQEFVPHSTHERLLQEVRQGNRTASDAVFSAADRHRNRYVLAGAGGTRREYVKQLFIRGDNVVSVSAVDTANNRPQNTSRLKTQRLRA